MDISSLRERQTDPILSVTDVNLYLKGLLEADSFCRSLTVRGEISNFVAHSSGHFYFTVKDEESQIAAVMFRSSAEKMQFFPQNGMKVILSASLTVYSPGGRYQLLVKSMQPDGIGALYLAFEQLKKKLGEEGLFSPERKKSIPKVPKKIGVITSPTGAAIRDVLHITGRRFPCADILLYPALVQGFGAEESILRGLEIFQKRRDIDVLIVGRGGGSFEDLNVFNSEKIARKIAKMPMPVISAVGHETDFTICDFVADLRAPTPSAAAEICTPDRNELLMRLDGFSDQLRAAVKAKIQFASQNLERLKGEKSLSDIRLIFGMRREAVSALREKLLLSLNNSIEHSRLGLSALSGKLSALSPLAVLGRGYSIVSKEERAIASVDALVPGDEIMITLSDGRCKANVEGIEEKQYAEDTEKRSNL